MPLALILVRWLHLLASILLASLFLFEAVIVLPATRKLSAGIGHRNQTVNLHNIWREILHDIWRTFRGAESFLPK